MTVLPVRGAAPYEVEVGVDVTDHAVQMLPAGVQRVALIVGEPLQEIAEPLRAALAESFELLLIPVPEGESAKTAQVANACWERLGEAGFTRSDAVVTFGGGATTDLGGYVAATWLRGVAVVHVPTTVLAMVDAAVGGKTGINTGAGKNLVGSFHEPAGVVCDLATLRTLPRRDFVAGLGEVVKCGFIADPAILELVEATPAAELTPDSTVTAELVERSVRVKIDVVVDDLKETGGAGGHPGREVLNYGHTMAHAIERASAYDVPHGEAVAIGCCYVAELARGAGYIDDALARRHRAAFAGVGLPTGWAGADFDTLHAAMKVDKKSRGNQLRFVVLQDLAQPGIFAGPDEDLLRAAYDRMVEEA